MTRCLSAFLAAGLFAAPLAAQVPSQSAKAYSDRLAALTDVQRRAALRRAVLDSGEKCVRVEKAAYQGAYRNLQMWVARCTGNLDYGAFIGPDGSVQVDGCAHLAAVKWPACRRLD